MKPEKKPARFPGKLPVKLPDDSDDSNGAMIGGTLTITVTQVPAVGDKLIFDFIDSVLGSSWFHEIDFVDGGGHGWASAPAVGVWEVDVTTGPPTLNQVALAICQGMDGGLVPTFASDVSNTDDGVSVTTLEPTVTVVTATGCTGVSVVWSP